MALFLNEFREQHFAADEKHYESFQHHIFVWKTGIWRDVAKKDQPAYWASYKQALRWKLVYFYSSPLTSLLAINHSKG